MQLCAQALCLEEMTGRTVPEGALFYAETRRRVAVPFDADLRAPDRDTTALHSRALFAAGRTPPAGLPGGALPRLLAARTVPAEGDGAVRAWLSRRARSPPRSTATSWRMKKLLNTLYVTTEGAGLRKDGENFVAEVDGAERARVPLPYAGLGGRVRRHLRFTAADAGAGPRRHHRSCCSTGRPVPGAGRRSG